MRATTLLTDGPIREFMVNVCLTQSVTTHTFRKAAGADSEIRGNILTLTLMDFSS